ncbi:MAG: hypothetical protein HKO57_16885 [Akkermansiaceae bacterium]|nr:hypothetical protein [Akkermansiaceae bacterium]
MAADPSSPSKPKQTPLPESLKEQLTGFRSQLWKIKVAEAVLCGFFGLLASYLVVFGLDRVWATPATVRLAVLIGGTSLFVFFAPYWIHRWVFGHRREDQLARLIARRFPKLGDRLLGVVELQRQNEAEELLSPELRAAAMKNVAKEAKGRDFVQALPASRHRSWSLAVLATFAVAGAALVFVPKAGLNALKRWIMPLSDTPRYTFTRLEDFSKHMVVPYGESFDLALKLRDDSDNRPPLGTARYGAQPAVESALDDSGLYVFSFPGQQAQDFITIHIGDARHRISVEPTLRPTVESLSAVVTYPEYLELPEKRIDLRAGVLPVVVDSTVGLEATASRELQSASLVNRPLPLHEGLPDSEAAPEPPPPSESSLRVHKRKLFAPAIPVTAHPAELTLSWTDVLGLEGAGRFRLRVDPVVDQAPSVYIQGIDRQRVMLEEETVEFDVLGEDDFGVKRIGIEWRGQFTKPTDETPANGELALADSGDTSDLQRLSEEVAFSPSTLGISPQKLIIRAYAEDFRPDGPRAYSDPITIFILTRDEHAQLLKNTFDGIIGELEDAARREQNNFDENQRLERLEDPKLQEDEARDRLQQQEAAEAENTERMQDLARRMEELLKDAVRNGEIDKETMTKIARAMQKMQELGNQDMPEVEQSLRDSQDQRSTPDQSKKDLQEAIEKQKDVLEKMQETIEEANEANRNFEASTFINRLKRAASEEDSIAAALIDSINSIIGMSVEGLDPADQRLIGELSMQQRRTASDVRWIQEDLGHFYARTQKEIHKELLTEMQASHVDTALDDNRERIAENQSYKSIAICKQWAEQLREWAAKLEGPKDGGGGGGGGGGGAGPNDDDFEFMLKVMRMIQKEQDIRSRTRAREQLRRSLGQIATP